MRGQKGHLLEDTGGLREERAFQVVKIYSVLKSHRGDLEETSAWTIARTIVEESEKYSLDPMLVLAIIKVESRFQQLAVSRVGARGLMQIRPFVARALASEIDLKTWRRIESLLDDPVFNIKIGVFYLDRLKKRFRSLRLALTAYNWGPTEIRNRLRRKRVVPTHYAFKVLSAYRMYSRGEPS